MLNLVARCGWVANVTRRPLYQLYSKPGGPQGRSGGVWRRKKTLFPTGVRTSNRPDCSDYVVPAPSVTLLYLHVNNVTDILVAEYIS